MNTKHELLNISKGFILGITVILGMSAIAWNGPVSAPPNYNAYAPINISAASQTKDGALWASSFLTTGGGYFGGNVGIGTSNPTAKLEIQGAVKIVNGNQGAGKILTSDVNGLVDWQAPMHFQIFNSSGIFTVPPGITQITVELWGGGGGGAGGGSGEPSGAGGGGYGRDLFTVIPNTTYTVTVGIGGGGQYGCGPGAGGTSSFGSLISATGGRGGDCSGIGGTGGTSTAGTQHFNGNSGGEGNGAPGGNAANGGGNGGGIGGAGVSPGGGGGGCSVCTGGNGAPGRVIVWW